MYNVYDSMYGFPASYDVYVNALYVLHMFVWFWPTLLNLAVFKDGDQRNGVGEGLKIAGGHVQGIILNRCIGLESPKRTLTIISVFFKISLECP